MMARLNTRPSYRASSRLHSVTPQLSNSSDEENRDPHARRMGKGPNTNATRQQTFSSPESDSNSDTRGQKRKRGEIHGLSTQPPAQPEVGHEAWLKRYFDPNQDAEVRRDIKKRSRALERDFQENREDLLREATGEGLKSAIQNANNIFQHVKQTNDATVDSRLLVNISNLAFKKTAQLVLGDTGTGIDVDEFLSKCVTYMRDGVHSNYHSIGTAAPIARRRRSRHDSENEDEGEHDDITERGLDWEAFGCCACHPTNSRPAIPSFLLGPLSVQKKQRLQTQRHARHGKNNTGEEARPEEVTRDHLSQSEESGLTAICTRIRNLLARHINMAVEEVRAAGYTQAEHLELQECQHILNKHHVSKSGGVSLFEFVLNRRSFGQTVENLFYVSFLIKEGSVGVQSDSDGLPEIVISSLRPLSERQKDEHQKRQAVLALDYATWERLKNSFRTRDFTIQHREEDQSMAQPSQRGWYT